MVNRYQPHLLVLPEDRANRELAKGFQRFSDLMYRRVQVLPEANGWRKVLESFQSDHIGYMDRLQHRLMVLLIDFDGQENRLQEVKSVVPGRLNDRVFVLGAWTEPEDLRQAGLGSYESIGMDVAEDCRAETGTTLGHPRLRHNADEIERLRTHVRPFLFQSV